MAIQKAQRFIYVAKNNRTGLSDVKGQLYLNGVSKAVAGSALTFAEVDATNSPGLYELTISAATLTGWGVAQGVYNNIEIFVNSVTAPAPSATRYEVTVANIDDIDIKLGSPAGASVSADIAAVKSDTTAIKADLETGSSSLANILAAISNIENNAGFAIPVPPQFITYASTTNTYKIPVTIYNTQNGLVDPDSNLITVGLVNQAGTDRGAYLTGSSGSPLTVSATRISMGQYVVTVVVPAAATNEQLIFTFSYAIGGVATARKSTTQVVNDVQADGFALQSTLLAVQTTAADTNTKVTDVQSKINDGTIGLSAANTLQNSIYTQTQNTNTTLANATYGLSAIKTAVAAIQTDMTNNVEGTGFSSSTDSLHQISLFLINNLYSGGRVI